MPQNPRSVQEAVTPVMKTNSISKPIAVMFPALVGMFLLIGCGRSGAGAHTVGGSVSGLLGSGLVLQNKGGDNLAIRGNGPFTFATTIEGQYIVTVLVQPMGPAQTCTIA